MVRILDAESVTVLINEGMVVESIRRLFAMRSGSDQIGYGRVDLRHPNGWLRSLPAFVAPEDLLGLKVLHRTEGVGMRYTIYVHRLSTGELIGVVDALEVTNLRTGAVSAVATEHMAKSEVQVAALVGTGPVARGQLRAIELVRPVAETRVFARTPENRARFVAEMSPYVSGTLVDSGSLDDALDGADLITLATKATSPVLVGEHLHPGIHVNSVGPASRDRVEVDPSIFESFDRMVCDSVQLVFDEAGDAHRAAEGGGFRFEQALDLADVVSGNAPGRLSPEDMTLFKSVGTGAQDLVVASRLLEAAAAADFGTVVDDVNAIKQTPHGR